MSVLQMPALVANPFSCMVRVEMREGTTWENYAELHQEMARLGFTKEIVSDEGVRFGLPDAVYYGTAYVDIEPLRDVIWLSANRVYPGPSVLVMEAPRSAWHLPVAH